MNRWLKWLTAVGTAALVSACGGSDDDPLNVVQTAQTQSSLSSLVAAATKAGLVDTLANTQNLTVFAPTNDAFNALATSLGFPTTATVSSGAAMVAALDGPTLAKILTYHVLGSKKLAADLSAPGAATQPTLYKFPGTTPTTLTVDASSGVKIGDAVLTKAAVTTANVQASNGVIHIVDKVLVPPGVLTVVQMAQANPTFSVLVEAVVAANLASTLSAPGPFTVFAPVNNAFTAALTELALTKAQLLASPDLAGILTYHVVAGNVRAADVVALPKPARVTTVQGSAFTVGATLGITDGRARTANLVATDVIASNGVIHVIDKVLLPAAAPQ